MREPHHIENHVVLFSLNGAWMVESVPYGPASKTMTVTVTVTVTEMVIEMEIEMAVATQT